ncbi:Sec61beta family-domain-containing protein [Mrakia frigida]|uniref:SEC61-beta family protein n=1 Tax=Mrakia frigida TaxID=29902 RepID=UPI003FCBFD92
MSSASSSAIARPVSPDSDVAPAATGVRRRAAAGAVEKAGSSAVGGSSQTMLRLYTPDGEGGLKVDPFVVVILSLAFIASIFFLHISSKLIRIATKA